MALLITMTHYLDTPRVVQYSRWRMYMRVGFRVRAPAGA